MRSPCAGFYWAESVAAARARRVLVRRRRGAPADAGRGRRVHARRGRAVPVPQPRLPVANSARAVLEPAGLGRERLGLRRLERQPRVRRRSACATARRSSRSRTPRTRARSSRSPATPSPWREVKVYQVFDAGANRWRAYAYVSTEAANSGVQTHRHVGPAADGGPRVDEPRHELAAHAVRLEHRLRDERGAAGDDARAVRRRQQLERRLVARLQPREPRFTAARQQRAVDALHARLDEPRRHGRAGGAVRAGHDPCEVLVDFNVDQVELWDVTNKLQPVLLGTATNPNNRYIHSGWPTADGTHLIFHDELEEIQLGLADADLHARPRELARADGASQPHGPDDDDGPQRLHARHELLRLALPARRRRLRRREPRMQLVEVAHFDNYVTPSANIAGTDGAWGVYPFLPSGNLLVSDIENGLFVLRDQTRNARLRASVGSVSASSSASGTKMRRQRSAFACSDARAGSPATSACSTRRAAAPRPKASTTGRERHAVAGRAGDIGDKVIAIPVDRRHERRKRRDVDADAVGARRTARRSTARAR